MARQWIRACSLTVGDMVGNGIELAGNDLDRALRIRFQCHYALTDSPASLNCRIYNLSDATVQKIVSFAKEGTVSSAGVPFGTTAKVVLKAGYVEALGTIFTGQIYQLRTGKESNVDSYLDIFAADGDYAHNWAYCNVTLSSGWSPATVWQHAGQTMPKWQTQPGPAPDGLSTRPSPRGKVLFGNTREVLNDLGNTNNFTWNILDGQLQGMPKFTYRPGDVIKINSQTGMIGAPEQTEAGLSVQTLINPAIRWGTLIQIDEADVSRYLLKNPTINAAVGSSAGNQSATAYIPLLNPDGRYVVLYANHMGDTRGTEWYTRSIALSVDPSAVKPKAIPILLPPPIGG